MPYESTGVNFEVKMGELDLKNSVKGLRFSL
jgi:hypothetical protein